MNLLIIDTTRNEPGTILLSNDEMFLSTEENYFRHSESLLQSVEEVLTNGNVELKDLSSIGVVTGPGSFTGIRVGLATVKAFATTTKVNVISANMFEVLTHIINDGIVLIQSTNTSFYYGIIEKNSLIKFGIVDSDKLDVFLDSTTLTLYCFENERKVIETSYNNIETINNFNIILKNYFEKQFVLKNFKDVNLIEPFYIQLSQAERELLNKGS